MKSTSKVFRAFLPVTILLGFALVGHVEAAGTWSPTDSMSTARFVHTATLLSDGRVLVAGGFERLALLGPNAVTQRMLAQDGPGQRAIAVLTLAFAPVK